VTPEVPIQNTPETSPKIAYGKIKIESRPQGARIFLNKEDTGQTSPTILEKIPIGKRNQIRLELEGYKPNSKVYNLDKPEDSIVFEMEQILMTLNLQINPSNALVFMDGQERGYVIENLQAGKKYNFKFQAKGYETQTFQYEPKPNPERSENLTITLKKIRVDYGSISIGAEPWAEVLLDGKKIGETPIPDFSLPVGIHTFEFTNPSFKSVKQKVQIHIGTNKKLIVTFHD
jgi:hypothetical protein